MNLKKNLSQSWIHPKNRSLKMNFDATFKDGKTIIGVILRNHEANIFKAWVNPFISNNSFCSKSKAATQAFHNGKDMRLKSIEFEGDAFKIIMILSGMEHLDEWRDKKNLMLGLLIDQPHLSWLVSAIWLNGLPPYSCRFIEVTTLPTKCLVGQMRHLIHVFWLLFVFLLFVISCFSSFFYLSLGLVLFFFFFFFEHFTIIFTQ